MLDLLTWALFPHISAYRTLKRSTDVATTKTIISYKMNEFIFSPSSLSCANMIKALKDMTA